MKKLFMVTITKLDISLSTIAYIVFQMQIHHGFANSRDFLFF